MATSLFCLFLVVCSMLRESDAAAGFVLKQVTYVNGSTVLRTNIGEGAAALHCTTDSTTCCTNSHNQTRAGEFYYPDGRMVDVISLAPSDSYYRSRSTMMVNLNRRSAAMQTGQFRCEIPDASGTLIKLYINIENELPTMSVASLPITSSPATEVDTTTGLPTEASAHTIAISINAVGNDTAGATYQLECYATVAGSTDQLSFTWLDPMNNSIPSQSFNSTGGMSTLIFDPLMSSHAGTYTCVVAAGDVIEMQAFVVNVNGLGVYLSLNSGVIYPNNSIILITKIGFTNDTSNNELQCITDSRPCCSRDPNRHGGWVFPNGSVVPQTGAVNVTTFHQTSGEDGTVNLARLNSDVVTPTGRFCCVVPDAAGISQRACVILSAAPSSSNLSIHQSIATSTSQMEHLVTMAAKPVEVTIAFKLTSSQDSRVFTFSLTCNSTGGPVSSMIWTRDGLLLDNTGPLVQTDSFSFSYSNVLQVNRSKPGTYICQIRGYNNQVLSSVDFVVHAAAPPINLLATQANTHAPVEVSWSPPTSGISTVTGYRIFYDNDNNLHIPSVVTGVTLALSETSSGNSVFIRSEADQLGSQLIAVTITCLPKATNMSADLNALHIGVTVGIMLVLYCLVSVAIIAVLTCVWRKKRTTEKDLDALYARPDKLTNRERGNYELTQCSAYDCETPSKSPDPPPRAETEEDESSLYAELHVVTDNKL